MCMDMSSAFKVLDGRNDKVNVMPQRKSCSEVWGSRVLGGLCVCLGREARARQLRMGTWEDQVRFQGETRQEEAHRPPRGTGELEETREGKGG